jgi:3'(2'), 5'-bisphosphate nucleotidase
MSVTGDHARELAIAERAARAGGAAIRDHYARGAIDVETKADASPVTAADRDANDAILAILREAFPGDAILSEETVDDRARLSATRVWIVDPLDGTRDVIARTGEFNVHVGLAVDGIAVVGAVYRPTTDELFSAAAGQGAHRTHAGARGPIHVSSLATPRTIGTSRLNASSLLAEAVANFATVAVGASVKLMQVATGELDAVVALSSSESEWDTCAPEVVVREAGGKFTDAAGQAFRYNLPDTTHPRGSLATNAACHDALVAHLAPFVARMSR